MNLEADYCHAADNQDAEAYASVFTDDGALDLGTFGGRIVGREAIREFCREVLPAVTTFSMHCLHNPRLTVSGDTAKGRFLWEAAITWKATDEAVWQAGCYDDEYVRTDGAWRIKEKIVTFYYQTHYDKGWAKEKFMSVADMT